MNDEEENVATRPPRLGTIMLAQVEFDLKKRGNDAHIVEESTNEKVFLTEYMDAKESLTPLEESLIETLTLDDGSLVDVTLVTEEIPVTSDRTRVPLKDEAGTIIGYGHVSPDRDGIIVEGFLHKDFIEALGTNPTYSYVDLMEDVIDTLP